MLFLHNHLKEGGRKSEGGEEGRRGREEDRKGVREGGRERVTKRDNKREYSIHIISSLGLGGGKLKF